jgi:hypothetical protein
MVSPQSSWVVACPITIRPPSGWLFAHIEKYSPSSPRCLFVFFVAATNEPGEGKLEVVIAQESAAVAPWGVLIGKQ